MKRKIIVFSEKIEHQEIKQNALPSLPGRVLKYLPLVKAAVVMQDTSQDLVGLSAEGYVIKVIDDVKLYAVETLSLIPQPPQTLPWGVDRIDAEKAWHESTGENVRVAVMDTGIDITHPDLTVSGGINTISPGKSFKDDNGHGTHVAGTIAALNNRLGVIGVAHNASLYSVKVMGANGSGYLSDTIEGLEWCINNRIQVINMSFGQSEDEELLYEAVKHVYNAGIFITAAAGNSGPFGNNVIYPAKYPEVAAISASSQDDGISFFSSRGPEVDLAAPGVNILSTYRNSFYRKLSGTSMASPHVAGVAALVLARRGPMSPFALLNHLKETAQDIHHSPEEQGAGLIDAYTAVAG